MTVVFDQAEQRLLWGKMWFRTLPADEAAEFRTLYSAGNLVWEEFGGFRASPEFRRGALEAAGLWTRGNDETAHFQSQ